MNAKVMLMCVSLLQQQWLRSCAAGDGSKRMPEPLMRRSPLDKNFMRFGRSWTEPEERGDLARPGRSKPDNFIRFGRAGNGNSNFIRFGRPDKHSNFMRFGRGKQENFMRFGRGKPENFIRFGRGKQENFMRFGRGKPENFIRFGRGKQENFMRFGRGKNENIIRFGRGGNEDSSYLEREEHEEEPKVSEQTRSPSGSRSNSNFLRFGKRGSDSFMRFGRSHLEDTLQEENGGQERDTEPFGKYDFSDPGNRIIRLGGRSAEQEEKDPVLADGINRSLSRDSLADFLGSSKEGVADDTGERDTNEQRVQELYTDDPAPKLSHTVAPYQDSDATFNIPAQPMWIREKRSLGEAPNVSARTEQCKMAAEPLLQFDRYPSPLAAGLPNFIVGPELSLLPLLDSYSSRLKRGKQANRNFMRLG